MSSETLSWFMTRCTYPVPIYNAILPPAMIRDGAKGELLVAMAAKTKGPRGRGHLLYVHGSSMRGNTHRYEHECCVVEVSTRIPVTEVRDGSPCKTHGSCSKSNIDTGGPSLFSKPHIPTLLTESRMEIICHIECSSYLCDARSLRSQ